MKAFIIRNDPVEVKDDESKHDVGFCENTSFLVFVGGSSKQFKSEDEVDGKCTPVVFSPAMLKPINPIGATFTHKNTDSPGERVITSRPGKARVISFSC
jgi:hypothetical protein